MSTVSTFYGAIVKPKSSVEVGVEDGTVVHLSNICLAGEKLAKGSTIVKLKAHGQEYVICRLAEGTYEQHTCDFFFDASGDAEFIAEGPHEVHIVGFKEVEMEMDSDMEEFDEDEEDEEDM